MSDENVNVKMDRDVDLCRLVMDYAQYISRIQAPDAPASEVKPNARMLTPDDIRASANLCFLAMDMIQERGAR